MLEGRFLNVSFDDIRKVYLPAAAAPHSVELREQVAENISPDAILLEILGEVKEKVSGRGQPVGRRERTMRKM